MALEVERPHLGDGLTHVGKGVLAGSPRRGERQFVEDQIGLVPADEIEQFECLLGVDDPVAVTEMVHRGRLDEASAYLSRVSLSGETTGDPHRCVVILPLDRFDEIAGPGIAAPSGGTTPCWLGERSEGLYEWQRTIVTIALDRPGEAVDGSGHGVPDAPLLSRQGVLEANPCDRFGHGVVGQETDRVAGDLADIVVLDTASQTRPETFSFLGGGRLFDGHVHLTVLDLHCVTRDVFFAHHTLASVDPEFPVVPLARDELSVQRARHQAVPLVGAGVVNGVNPGRGANHGNAALADLHHFHLTFTEVFDRAHHDGGSALARGWCVGLRRQGHTPMVGR